MPTYLSTKVPHVLTHATVTPCLLMATYSANFEQTDNYSYAEQRIEQLCKSLLHKLLLTCSNLEQVLILPTCMQYDLCGQVHFLSSP